MTETKTKVLRETLTEAKTVPREMLTKAKTVPPPPEMLTAVKLDTSWLSAEILNLIVRLLLTLIG